MPDFLIPQLSQTLQDFRSYFTNQSHSLTRQIRTCTQRFTEEDRMEFDNVLDEIKEFAIQKITNFINTRIEYKSKTFTDFFEDYESSTQNLRKDLETFRMDIESHARKLKEEEEEGEQLLEKITENYSRIEAKKKAFRTLKLNTEESLGEKKQEARMNRLYETRLKKKSFFPWRALTYKGGYENTVRRQGEAELRKIHAEFGSIVSVLKEKIMETQQLLKTKRAAKTQFAYALSKNLLKTISNLSLEVMSLNQITTHNRQSEKETEQFLNDIHQTIQARIQNVTTRKQIIPQDKLQFAQSNNPEAKERKEIPNRILSPRSKNKRISFA